MKGSRVQHLRDAIEGELNGLYVDYDVAQRIMQHIDASIADTADNAQCDTGKCGIGGYCKECPSIADTAGANCATCGAVGTVTSTKARCTLCGMFADTAGAKPDDDEPEPTPESDRAARNATTQFMLIRCVQLWRAKQDMKAHMMWVFNWLREQGISGKALGDSTVKIAAPPAPSVADAAGAEYDAEFISCVIHQARQRWAGSFVYTPEQVVEKAKELAKESGND